MAMLSRRRHAGIAILLLLLLWLLQEETYKVQTVSLRRTVAIYSQHLVLSTKARRTLHLPEQFVLTQQNTFFATTKAEARFQPILKSLKMTGWRVSKSRKFADLVFVNNYEEYSKYKMRRRKSVLLNHVGVSGMNKRMWRIRQHDIAHEYGCTFVDLEFINVIFNMSNVQQCQLFFKRMQMSHSQGNNRQLWRRTSISKEGRLVKIFQPSESRLLRQRYQPCHRKTPRNVYEALDLVPNQAVGLQVRTYVLIASTKPHIVFNRLAYAYKAKNGVRSNPWENALETRSIDSLSTWLGGYLPSGFIRGQFQEKVDQITNFLFQSIRHEISSKTARFHIFSVDFEFTLGKDVKLVDFDFAPMLHEVKELPNDYWSSMVELLLFVQLGDYSTASESSTVRSSPWNLVFDEQHEISTGQLYDPCSKLKWRPYMGKGAFLQSPKVATRVYRWNHLLRSRGSAVSVVPESTSLADRKSMKQTDLLKTESEDSVWAANIRHPKQSHAREPRQTTKARKHRSTARRSNDNSSRATWTPTRADIEEPMHEDESLSFDDPSNPQVHGSQTLRPSHPFIIEVEHRIAGPRNKRLSSKSTPKHMQHQPKRYNQKFKSSGRSPYSSIQVQAQSQGKIRNFLQHSRDPKTKQFGGLRKQVPRPVTEKQAHDDLTGIRKESDVSVEVVYGIEYSDAEDQSQQVENVAVSVSNNTYLYQPNDFSTRDIVVLQQKSEPIFAWQYEPIDYDIPYVDPLVGYDVPTPLQLQNVNSTNTTKPLYSSGLEGNVTGRTYDVGELALSANSGVNLTNATIEAILNEWHPSPEYGQILENSTSANRTSFVTTANRRNSSLFAVVSLAYTNHSLESKKLSEILPNIRGLSDTAQVDIGGDQEGQNSFSHGESPEIVPHRAAQP